MFGLFKRTSWKIEGKSLAFFRSVFSSLPDKYKFLLDGLENGLLRRYSVNHSMSKNHFYVGFSPSLSDHLMIMGLQIELKNIKITEVDKSLILNLFIHNGLLSGFEFEKGITNLKDYKVDVSELQEIPFQNSKLVKVIGDLKSDHLELNNLSEVEVNGKLYYQIKDLDDGNYICIDNFGNVYGLIHDPFGVELIDKNLKQFVENVNSGQFDFNAYLQSKSESNF